MVLQRTLMVVVLAAVLITVALSTSTSSTTTTAAMARRHEEWAELCRVVRGGVKAVKKEKPATKVSLSFHYHH